MNNVKYNQALFALAQCKALAQDYWVYKYTLYPIDLGLAKLWLWWYSR
jgi:hypothetical protein